MNNSKKIFARQSIALLGSALILLNGLLVSCGPNQSLPQLMKSSVMNETSDDDSGSDDSGSDNGSESDDDSGSDDGSESDDSGSDDESPGSVSEPDPSPSSSSEDSGSAGTNVDGPTDADVSVDGQVTKIDFGFSGESTDNKGRDLDQDKDAERSVKSDGSISITEDKDEPTGSRTDTLPEGSPILGNNEGMGSGSGPGGKGNEGESGGRTGGTKDKETKKFPDLPTLVGSNNEIDGSVDKIIRDANALFESFGPDLNNKIGLAVTTHNNTVTAIFAGIALVALPAVAIPAWVIAGAAAAAITAIIANSKIDWRSIGNLLGGAGDNSTPELDDLEGHTHFSEGDQPHAPDTDGDGKPDIEKNPDGTPKLTRHAEEQMRDREVPQEAIDDALKHPLHVTPVKVDSKTLKPSQQYIGKDATVARNPETGAVLTTWKTGTTTRKKI